METPVEYNAGKKEEKRILIYTIRPECKFMEMHETTAGGHSWVDFMCGKSKIKNLECDEKCFEQCEWKELIGMTRSEAIEKMAKAICKFEMTCIRHICEECTEDCTDHLEMEVLDKATSALDALLEE